MPVSSPPLRRRAPVIRSHEWHELLESLDALRGGSGRIIEVAAQPGMGKTRLLRGLAEEAAERGVAVLSAQYTEVKGEGSGTGRLIFQGPSAEEPGPLADALAAQAEWWEAAPREGGALLYRAVKCLVRSADDGGLVVLLDDFHWADDRSIAIVEQLILHAAAHPLLVVITQRPKQASPRVRGALAQGVELGCVRRVELGPLTLEQSAAIAGMTPDDRELARLHRESAGVPLYLLALKGADADGRIPEQFAALILGEIAGLDAHERMVAGAAAVLGEDCGLDALMATTGLDREDTHRAVAELIRRDLLRSADHASFAFRHPIVCSLVHEHVDGGWHAVAHRRAIVFLSRLGAPAGKVAGHIERSLHGPDPDDARILRRAAEEALPTDPATAVRWLEAVCHISPADDPHRLQVQALLARGLGLTGRLAESRELLQTVLAELPAEPGELRAATVACCALTDCLLGNHAEARALLATELDAAAGVPEPPAEITALLIEDGIFAILDGCPPARDRIELAIRLAREHDDLIAEAGALALDGFRHGLSGHGESALRALAESAALIDRVTDLELARRAEYLGLLAWAETLMGSFGDAQRHFLRGVGIARRCRYQHVLPIFLLGLSTTHLYVGQMAETRRTAWEARVIAESTGARDLRGLALTLESLGAAWADPGPDALRLGEEAVAAFQGTSFYWGSAASMALATAARLRGDDRRAVTLIFDAGGGPEMLGLPVVLRAAAFQTLAAVVAETGRAFRAPSVASETSARWALLAEDSARSLGLDAQRAEAVVARAHALRTQGDPESALVLYREATKLYATLRMARAEAMTLISGATAALAAKRPDEVMSMLNHADELARRSGAGRIELQVRELRRRATPPIMPSVLSLLTLREREIADMAGCGKRTREIAIELSLSPRTVDVHLTRIYRKLNVSSRTALSRLLVEYEGH
jgi:DNA-binding CsgD family transcriptional regulator